MENKDNLQDELSSFRQQWQEELEQRSRSNSPQLQQENTCSENANVPQNQSLKNTDDESNESKAKVLFLNGVSLEQKGRIPEAIRYYRQAVQLVPDIESRISDFSELLPAKSDSSQELFTDVHDDEDDGTTNNHNTDIYTSKDLENVIKEFDKMNVNGICYPEFPTSKTHVSALPAELLMYIFKWVVSLRLDLRSLERLAQVCKGFYALARDPEIWRLVCLRVWGVNLGSTVSWNGSWREMYLKRAHLLYNGVYISKISYTRPTERTFEQHYTPYQLITYYRYLRFFTDGSVLFLTTPEEPQVSVSRLSQMNESTGNVWNGNYRLVGNKVLLVIQLGENVGYSSRRRGRRPAPQNNERVFHMELQLQNTKKRQNNKLTWVQYTCQTICRFTGQRTVSQFDLNNEQFCAYYFSRVKSYESFVSAPLGLGSS